PEHRQGCVVSRPTASPGLGSTWAGTLWVLVAISRDLPCATRGCMANRSLPHPRLGTHGLLLALFVAGGFPLRVGNCKRPPAPRFQTGHRLFTSPQFNPVAVSQDGDLVYVANTTSGTVSVIDTGRRRHPVEIAQIPVGIDPTGLAVRPKLDRDSDDEDEFIFV